MKTLEIYEGSAQKVKTAISIKASTAVPGDRLTFYITPEWREIDEHACMTEKMRYKDTHSQLYHSSYLVSTSYTILAKRDTTRYRWASANFKVYIGSKFRNIKLS